MTAALPSESHFGMDTLCTCNYKDKIHLDVSYMCLAQLMQKICSAAGTMYIQGTASFKVDIALLYSYIVKL